jgi:CubicO group peptidase (beta-lactamase class C family)
MSMITDAVTTRAMRPPAMIVSLSFLFTLGWIGSGIATLAAATNVAAQVAQVDPARIDEVFAFAANTQSPGCAVATIRDGKIEFARGYGMADLEHGLPITSKTAFNLASVSKQFTAAAINLLVAAGQLSLDDDVRKYVPELPRYDAPITIRHLVHHTSGLREISALFDLSVRSGPDISSADDLQMLARQRNLNFKPGAEYSYTNSGYFLLGLIVERVSGTSLRGFAEERMFRPLGMSSTTFRDRSDMSIENQAVGYVQRNGTWRPADPLPILVGPGALYSTVEDLALWQGHMMEPRLGGAPWRELTTARGTLTDGTTLRYGAGLVHGSFNGEPTLQHSGGIPGYHSFLMRFPRSGLSISVLCNGDPRASALARRVAALYVPERPAAAQAFSTAAVTLPEKELKSYAGWFFNRQMPFMREIVANDGKMYYIQGVNNRSELSPLGGSRFQVAGSTQAVTFLGRDTFRIDASADIPALNFVRVRAAKRDLRPYAGTYVSDELPARWTLQEANDVLTVIRPTGSAIRLNRAFEDGFRGSALGIIALFVRDQKGEIVAMDISALDWVRHIRFERQR